MFTLPARCAAANPPGRACPESARRRAGVRERCSSGIGFSSARERIVERRMFLGVEHRVVGEIRRRVGLIGRDQLDERLAAHRLQRVVRSPLLADRRKRFACPAPSRRAIRRRGPDRRGCRRATAGASSAASRRAGCRARPPTSQARTRRSGRPTSPTNNVSPVRTAYGAVALRSRSNTSSEIDSACGLASRAPGGAPDRDR